MVLEATDKKDPEKKRFNFEEFAYNNRIPLTLLLIGFILVGLGIILYKNDIFSRSNNIEILNSTEKDLKPNQIIIEVSGAVENSGVYKLNEESRIEDAIILAGGISADADRVWMDKFLNKASKLSDGQKVYIPKIGETSLTTGKQILSESAKNDTVDQSISSSYSNLSEEKVNINTADANALENLWGIGPVYAQNIIEQRPYSKVEELLEKKILKKNVYEKNKDIFTVY